MTLTKVHQMIGIKMRPKQLIIYLLKTDNKSFKKEFKEHETLNTLPTDKLISMLKGEVKDIDQNVEDAIGDLSMSLYDITIDDLECKNFTHDVKSHDYIVVGKLFNTIDLDSGTNTIKAKDFDLKKIHREVKAAVEKVGFTQKVKMYAIQDDCTCCS